jgi:oligopeptide transport system ATP-binding protein
MSAEKTIVRVENLYMYFPLTKGTFFTRQRGVIKAVDNITLDIRQGETLGLVGESGCGKSTFGRTIIQLYRPTSGKVYFHDIELTKLRNQNQLRKVRHNMQMLFQDPYASLNPRMKISKIIAEPLEAHYSLSKNERNERVKELLNLVGLSPNFMNRYPHEFSGGQRQRIGIARALAVHPEFMVLDEPVSALDVSIQAQVINLLEELQDSHNLTYLFIAHDLSVVRHISDRTAVMYLGKVVEMATRDELYTNPLHPYTQALMSAVPIPNPRKERNRKRTILLGDVPSPQNPPKGCRFHTRCSFAIDSCKIEEPQWRMIAPDHWVACFLPK